MSAGTFNFEIAFVVEDIDDPADERIDRVAELLPNFVLTSYGDLMVATVLVRAADAVEAGVFAAKAIESSGIRVLRTYQDLVTRQDIAERIGVTRQAVGNWVRGERHEDTPFPSAVSHVAGGIWLWGDVAAWARAHHYSVDDALFPSLSEHTRLDLLIAAGVRAVTVSTYVAAADITFRQRRSLPETGNSYQRSYALAS
ncbi:helix-turn-helix transcriptional regulator [Mycolicibacterium farcinogenes]|uniref:Helix-turn-helix domain-containing protein n=1 Tax=Mycolicibacterium farcinogenes TaxID=1802 RepID=A0ACD1FIM1_MYCFR|nr:helix-turn-helix transcriptional regulator [Mycolicibacterium farcinogenes]QZH66920.1 helix-turn-helix domain-containing protein [Mycolicibacterium farcinogenes]